MTNQKNNFVNRVEGEKAIIPLLEILGEERGTETAKNKNLLIRVSNLEREVLMLKDLFARALKINDNSVLND